MIPHRLIGVHKQKALFGCQMQEEGFDVTVTAGTTLCRGFQEIEDFFFFILSGFDSYIKKTPPQRVGCGSAKLLLFYKICKYKRI